MHLRYRVRARVNETGRLRGEGVEGRRVGVSGEGG